MLPNLRRGEDAGQTATHAPKLNSAAAVGMVWISQAALHSNSSAVITTTNTFPTVSEAEVVVWEGRRDEAVRNSPDGHGGRC